jgi:hypothetical protein
MRIKFKSRREGPVPLEAVVTISAAGGQTEETDAVDPSCH